jgi:prepilin peptidase CpaA
MTHAIWDMLRTTSLGLMLLTAAWSDLVTRRIPNRCVAWGSLAALAWALSPAGAGLTLSLLGGLVAALVFLVLHALGWMGAGDVKLAAACGLYFSPAQALPLCLTIFMAGGLLSLAWHLRARSGLKEHVPYGIAIALGTSWHAWHLAEF